MKKDPTQRFSTRVENYIEYRPNYPPAIIDTLKTECGLTPEDIIADVGAGTGKLTQLFLGNGNRVFGVEPNQEMREAGIRLLQNYPHFTSIAGAAEATTLPSHNIDFVTVGQALHWFKLDQARLEFERILKPQGWVVLVWNTRRTGSTPFSRDYEQLLLTYGLDYTQVGHMQLAVDPATGFFKSDPYQLTSFENYQHFDFEGLKGRLLSSSYSPEPGHPNHQPMLKELEKIFQRHQAAGKISFEYDTHLYYGRLSKGS
jgi:ubiquinone/menaquinone biosynthesis C-methylase UbiE